MKNLLVLILLANLNFCLGQSAKTNIDPRKFIKVYEKQPKKTKETLIWEMDLQQQDSSTILFSKQYSNAIDSRSTVLVKFDHAKLINDINFFGSLSLRAYLNDEPIEIDPYFVLGKKQEQYGIESKSPKEIAKNFYQLVFTTRRFLSLYDETEMKHEILKVFGYLGDYRAMSTSDERKAQVKKLNDELIFIVDNILKKDFKSNLDSLKRVTYLSAEFLEFGKTENRDASYTKQVLDELRLFDRKFDLIIKNPTIFTYHELLASTSQIIANVGNENDRYIPDHAVRGPYNRLIRTSKRCLRYLNYINTAGRDSKKAFLEFTDFTVSDFDNIVKEFDSSLKYLADYSDWLNLGFEIKDSENKLEQLKKISHIENLLSLLHEVDESLTKKTEDLIKELIDQNTQTYYDEEFNYKDKSGQYLSYGLEDSVEQINEQRVIEELSRYAAQSIYQKLVAGTIDLEKHKYQDGDRLDIYVLWNHREEINGLDAVSSQALLPIGKFKVHTMGWRVSVSESVQLVNRINSDKLEESYPVSPSTFKPTAGAVLLWTLHNDYSKRGFMRAIEPSLGINVTYLDFNRDKDFEFGVGPTFGMFKNQIHLTFGLNLNEIKTYPLYYGVGFSFANILLKKDD